MVHSSHFPLRRDLGIQLLTLYLAFVVVVLAAAFVFMRSANQQLEMDVVAADLALAHAIAQETHTVIQSALDAVRQISHYPSVLAADSSAMHDLFQHLMSGRSDVNLTYRLDARGLMVFHYPIGPESTVGQDFSFREYYQQAKITHEPLLSSGRISPTTGQPVATAVMPLWSDDGRFLGLVATNIKLQFLSETLTNIAAISRDDASEEIAIIDSVGLIVAHSNPDFLLQNGLTLFPEVISAISAGETGDLIAVDPAGVERLYSYVPIPQIQWGAVVSRPVLKAFAAPLAFRHGIVVVSAIFLVSGLVFWMVLSRRVIRPIERLARRSQNFELSQPVGSSPLTSFPELTHRSDQMGVLTRSLNQMQDAIEANLNELATLLKTSTAVVSSLDTRVVLDRILEQVEQLLGVHMSAIFILDDQANIFRVRASRNLPQWYMDEVRIDPLDPNSLTMRAIRSGEPVQVSDTDTDLSYTQNRVRAQRAGYRSLLAIRLPVQHVKPAALLVCRAEPYVFSEREINLLTSFAHHATMAIENAALYARSDMHLQEQTRRLEALIDSMHDGLVLEDSAGKILYANRRIRELLRLHDDLPGSDSIQHLMDTMLAATKDAASAKEDLEQALSSQGIRVVNLPQLHNGSVWHMRLTLFNVNDTQGAVIGRGWIVQDVTERHELDRMKSNLIATVSHELRTPLAAIKGYTTTLLADDVQWDADSQREFLLTISAETDRLNSLVRDLLDMSRLEAGNLAVSRISCDFPQLIAKAVSHAMPRLADRLRLTLPDSLPPVFVDPQRIEAVLRNLIENAAKYSPEDQPIQLEVRLEGGHLITQVIDFGPGIPKEHRERVFDSFYRIENGMTRSTSGAGLGLSIARGFVQIHGGKIWLEPSEIGTRIAFSIPVQLDTREVMDQKQPDILSL